jgi:hypothetical protein
MNRLETGIYARSNVLPVENQAKYDKNIRLWIDNLKAGTVSEVFFASSAGDAAWRYVRGLKALDSLATLEVNRSHRPKRPTRRRNCGRPNCWARNYINNILRF